MKHESFSFSFGLAAEKAQMGLNSQGLRALLHEKRECCNPVLIHAHFF